MSVITIFLIINIIDSYVFRILNFFFKLHFLLIFFSISGCYNVGEGNIPTINVSKDISGEILLSDIAESAKTIQLETSNNALLGIIYDVKLFNKQLYVTDRTQILIFDMQGKFLGSLGKRGEGPGEYRGVTSFTIDPISGNVFLASDNRILVYSPNSKLLMENKLSMGTDYISFNEGNLFMLLKSFGNKVEGGFATYISLVRLTSEFKLKDSIPIKSFILKKNIISGYPYKHYLSENDRGTFLYFPVLSPENMIRDTVYQLRDNKLIPSIKLKFEKQQLFEEEGSKAINILNITNSSTYLICEYSQDGEWRLFIYNKNLPKGFNLKEGPFDDQGDPVMLRPLDMENDMFFYIKNAKYANGNTQELNPKIGIVQLKK